MIRVYPNPFRTSTQIRYTLQEGAKVQITIYTLLGQKAGVLEDKDRGPGTHTLTWDGTDAHGNELAVGTYICCIQAGSHREVVKIVLLK
jgi:flagellar hook assembly protein FlgD